MYNKYNSLINRKELKEEYREISYLYHVVDVLHEKIPDNNLSVDEVEAFFWAQYPEASHDIYDGLLSDLRNISLSDVVGEQVLAEISRKKTATRLSEAAYALASGRGSLEEVEKLTEELKTPTTSSEEFEKLSTSLIELIKEEKLMPGLKWRLNCFNISIGPLRKGALGHIFARVETGKSAMWISEITHMIPQLKEDQTCVIFFNEEGGRDIMYRLYSAMLETPYHKLLENPVESERAFYGKGGGKIVFIDRPILYRREMESILEQTNPGLIVIDSLDKIAGFEAERNDLVLAAKYKWGRTIAKTYAPVLSVGQADATANNMKWLSEAQMADSKTGKPAELDFVIGIGRMDIDGQEWVRYISVPKNKLRGDENTDENFRHGRFETILKNELSIYKDIGVFSNEHLHRKT